ncbi:MAG: hypothetical protein AAF614_42725 [Chloroflexota bacterium]
MQPEEIRRAKRELWLNRWQSLELVICETINLLEKSATELNCDLCENCQKGEDGAVSVHEYERADTLRALLVALYRFGCDQFCFFLDGFFGDKDGKDPYLIDSQAYPADFALKTTLQQLQFDYVVIRSAMDLRIKSVSSNPYKKSSLLVSDALAQSALRFAQNKCLVNPAVALTYLKNRADIRVVPYAPVMLIGLPINAITSGKPHVSQLVEWMAIPHEVGHYVFNNAMLPNKREFLADRLRSELSDLPVWVSQWLEEIFADVYGLLIVGPLFAFTAYDRIDSRPFSEQSSNDGEHPLPYLRPYINIATLKQLTVPAKEAEAATDETTKKEKEKKEKKEEELFGRSRESLERIWEAQLERFQDQNGLLYLNGGPLKPERFKQIVERVVKKILSYLKWTPADTVWFGEKDLRPLFQGGLTDEPRAGLVLERLAGKPNLAEKVIGKIDLKLLEIRFTNNDTCTTIKVEEDETTISLSPEFTNFIFPNPQAKNFSIIDEGLANYLANFTLNTVPLSALPYSFDPDDLFLNELRVGFGSILQKNLKPLAELEFTLGKTKRIQDSLKEIFSKSIGGLQVNSSVRPELWLPILHLDGWNTAGGDNNFKATHPLDD